MFPGGSSRSRLARTNFVATILRGGYSGFGEEGAQRFTTIRVAEKAGVSIGSLYQYFPNKRPRSSGFRGDEWKRTSDLLRDILEDKSNPPFVRLRSWSTPSFARSEGRPECAWHFADAAPLYRDTPEEKKAMAEGDRIVDAFMREALPKASLTVRAMAGDLITTTLAKRGNDSPRRHELRRKSEA